MGAPSFDFLFLNPRVVPKLGATRGRPPSEVGVHLRLHLPDTGVVWNVTECDRATGRARGYVQGAPQPWRSFHLAVLLLCGVRRIRDARVLTLESYYPDATADAGFNERPGADNAEL